MRYFILAVLLFSLISCKDSEEKAKPKDTIVVAGASSLSGTLELVAKAFEKKTSIECKLVYGSSGKLTAQIVEGAPFDVFLSANEIYPQLISKHKTLKRKADSFAKGTLVIWSNRKHIRIGIEALESDSVRKIAIANPGNAPYGKAAMQALTNFGILDAVRSKLVFGENVGQTTQFIASGASEIGFTALALIYDKKSDVIGYWQEVPDSLYDPIVYTALLLNEDTSSNKSAQLFMDFISTEEAKLIYVTNGLKAYP